jgi:hypothetical protein
MTRTGGAPEVGQHCDPQGALVPQDYTGARDLHRGSANVTIGHP